MASGREFSTLPFNHASCLQSVYSPNGKLLAGGSENGTVYFVDTEQLRNSLSAFMPH
jgi:WD40 repeat protein